MQAENYTHPFMNTLLYSFIYIFFSSLFTVVTSKAKNTSPTTHYSHIYDKENYIALHCRY